MSINHSAKLVYGVPMSQEELAALNIEEKYRDYSITIDAYSEGILSLVLL